MKLWHISQNVNNGHDTFDSAVVAADSEEEARNTLPATYVTVDIWAPADKVEVEYLGEAKEGTEAGVILTSFNAG